MGGRRPSFPRPPVLLVAAALALSLALAACGRGEEPTETPPTPGGATGAPPTTEEATPTLDVEAELEELAQRWEDREAKVVYQLTSERDGEVDRGSLIVYWKPPDWRADFQSGTELASVLQRRGDLFICEEADRTCFKVPVSGPTSAPLPFLFVPPSEIVDTVHERVAEAAAGVEIERSTRRIAGEEASCFSIRADEPAGNGGFETCWSEDGILLFLSTDQTDPEGGTFRTTMEATGVERTVSDRDVEPPYGVQELPFELPTPGG